jgi:uncharacterized protein (TIGR02452 family)
MAFSRDARAALGQETATIVNKGFYFTEEGKRVDIGVAVAAAIEGSELFQAKHCKQPISYSPTTTTTTTTTTETAMTTTTTTTMSPPKQTIFEVVDCGSITAALRLQTELKTHIAVHNFASAKNPGGGSGGVFGSCVVARGVFRKV